LFEAPRPRAHEQSSPPVADRRQVAPPAFPLSGRLRMLVIAGTLLAAAAIALPVGWLLGKPPRVMRVAPGLRLLAMSQGLLYFDADPGPLCRLGRVSFDGGRPVGGLTFVDTMSDCGPQSPVYAGKTLFRVATGGGRIVRYDGDNQAAPWVKHSMPQDLALDAHHVYVGDCFGDGCRIERYARIDGEREPVHASDFIRFEGLAVDDTHVYWREAGWARNQHASQLAHRPPPRRLVAVHKQQPRAEPMVLVAALDTEVVFLTAAGVVWPEGGRIWRVAKPRPENGSGREQAAPAAGKQPLFAATDLAAVAVDPDGSRSYLATPEGLWRIEERGGAVVEVKRIDRGSFDGVVADAHGVYAIDRGDDALVRFAR
jgi:hypothetical protein